MAALTAAYKGSKSVAEYQNSIKEYQAAVDAAPWFGDAYFNLGFAQDRAEKYAEALQSLKWDLMTSPDDKEIKALVYEVEYRNEKANSPEARAAAEQQTAVTAAKRLEGDWYRDVSSHDMSRSGVRYLETLSIRRDALGVWQVRFLFTGNSVVQADYHPYDVRFVGTELRFKIDQTLDNGGGRIEVLATNEITPTVSADGNTLRLAYKPMPFTATQQAHWAEWNKYVPEPHVDEFKRQ